MARAPNRGLAMLPEVPDELKYILPYLQRASELKARDPVVAYYCGFYAANLALKKGYSKTPENDAFLLALLDELGAEKESLKNEPAIQDDAAAKSHLIQFSLKIFLAADNEDRAGQASKKTARLFLVSSHFLEVLRVFGEVGEEVEERIKYAKWKAGDIVKALNEGRQPVAGPPGSLESTPAADTHSPPVTVHSPSTYAASPPAPTHTVSPPAPLYPTQPEERRGSITNDRRTSENGERNLPSFTGSYDSSPVVTPKPASPPSHPPPIVQTPPTAVYAAPAHKNSSPPYSASIHAAFDQAEKHSRYATSAIQFEDIPTAIREMETAIMILRQLQQQQQ